MPSRKNRIRHKLVRKAQRQIVPDVPIYHGIGKRGPIAWNERNSPDTGKYLVAWDGASLPSGGRYFASLQRAIELRDRLLGAIGRNVQISNGDLLIGQWSSLKQPQYLEYETPEKLVQVEI